MKLGEEVIALGIVYLIRPSLMRECNYPYNNMVKNAANKIYNLYVANKANTIKNWLSNMIYYISLFFLSIFLQFFIFFLSLLYILLSFIILFIIWTIVSCKLQVTTNSKNWTVQIFWVSRLILKNRTSQNLQRKKINILSKLLKYKVKKN